MSKPETVNHPAHYGGDNTYETIKVIEAWGLDFCLGNAVKYLSRAGKKGDKLEDLKKARWYVERAIQQEEKARGEAEAPPSTLPKFVIGEVVKWPDGIRHFEAPPFWVIEEFSDDGRFVHMRLRERNQNGDRPVTTVLLCDLEKVS